MTFFKKLLRELNGLNQAVTGSYQPITLERQFLNEVKLRKEINSHHVWCSYYIPLAAKEIIREQGNLTKQDEFKLQCLANSMMFRDLADGKLNELYRFE